jgi:hypothetical protein
VEKKTAGLAERRYVGPRLYKERGKDVGEDMGEGVDIGGWIINENKQERRY